METNLSKEVKKKRIFRSSVSEQIIGYGMVAPSIIIICAIALLPIYKTFQYSLQYMQLQDIAFRKYIYFDNYIKISKDPIFWQCITNTFYFTVFSVILELIFGFGAALIMNMSFKGRGVLRAAVLIPWAIPGIITALIWQYMFNDKLGIINYVLLKTHIINEPIVWLGTKGYAMWAVIAADVWKQLPFMALMLVAGLQMISKELYESSDVDGASAIEKLIYITIPLMKPVILVALLFRTMGAFKVFDTIYGITGGGPGNSTASITMYAYKSIFNDLNFGYGSALAIITFILVFILCLIYIRILGSKQDA